MKVLCPGSFDPITVGHLDIIERAHALFGQVVIAIGNNSQKKYMFSFDERVELVRGATRDLPGVTVEPMTGLLVDFCHARGIPAVVKGLRFGADFDFELQMAHMNRDMGEIETVLLPAAKDQVTLSSTIIRQVINLGGDVTEYVPANVLAAVAARRESERNASRP
ncbi:pantetheine-phosphate adenylyltransferase [Tessaracoccus flavus]|uniref:Phosphopantetheine adenylyltransferase n=1 Tax=Tessaracoccus flavus TaxID=1610493 RepID=A0A1Q2CFH2_9ACTN|nr:pantetheine-phosphate adenylyltransferase [Tessaracoccus flavus]AQP44858.1 pantetheine-phosphate adenylyltransferase [Tessaracoccus flavus]SDY97286.1 Phosphopantetheine adenylyltransferase [Tessaracoccus flavus]